MESLSLTRLQNYWEFPAPPIAPAALTAVGTAVRHRHLLVTETLRPDGTRPEPSDPDYLPAHRIEPHHLVVRAARLNLPAHIVARWVPGGSVVEHVDTECCRLTLGAWSWAGVAGILATFDTELTDLHPPELVHACRRLTRRWATIADTENLGFCDMPEPAEPVATVAQFDRPTCEVPAGSACRTRGGKVAPKYHIPRIMPAWTSTSPHRSVSARCGSA